MADNKAEAPTVREQSLLYHSRFMEKLNDSQPCPTMFNTLHHNVHSLLPKVTNYNCLPSLQAYDAISFSTSWLQRKVSNGLLQLPNFKIYRQDRPKRQGGGAAIYLKSEYNAKRLTMLEEKFA